jgi:hypothetical protein
MKPGAGLAVFQAALAMVEDGVTAGVRSAA